MTPYLERRLAGHYDADGPATETAALPRTHAELDEAAAERGHEWSADDLTVAAKQAELEA